jgi:hypothetical protein
VLTLSGVASRGVHGRTTGTNVLDLLEPSTSQDDVDNVPTKTRTVTPVSTKRPLDPFPGRAPELTPPGASWPSCPWHR